MSFERTIEIIGADRFERMQRVRVIIFGVGGVGGWCAEALVRTGIKDLTIVDFDTIADSNINRQVVATALNIGEPKVEQMRQRLLSISPDANIQAINKRYDIGTADEFSLDQYDYIVDAIDSLDCKMLLIHRATQTQATFFSSMGAGRKFDPQQIRVNEFWKVEGCPLARALRTKMRHTGLMPQHKFLCVYSPEISSKSGTLAPVVGIFGFQLASLIINDLSRQG